MSNVHIPLEHQSSPKETQLDKEIRLAAQDIADGGFTALEPEDGWFTGTETIAQHPRVQEALATLETQIQDRTRSEYVEAAQMFHELNANAQMAKQWPGQQRWEGPEAEAMRLVNPMTPFDFIDKLAAAGISAAKEPQSDIEMKANAFGVLQPAEVEHSSSLICLGRRVVRDCCGVFANVPLGDSLSTYQHVGTLQVPLGPEWDLIRFDEYGVPVNHRFRGWRTALLGLIIRGVLTEEQAHKAFGKPIENAASEFYRQQLFEFRNGVGR